MDTEALRSIFSTMPVDIVAAALFATVVTVDTLRSGASRAVSLSLGLVMATVLFAALPATYLIGPAVAGIATTQVASGIFAAITVLASFIMYRITASLSDDSARPLLAIATGVATTVVVMVVWQMTPLQNLWHFNAAIAGIFGASYRLYWLLLAFIAFAFVKS